MSDHRTCAIIVTFRPQAEVLKNVAKVRPQVGGLVVVDNGSSPELLASLHLAARDMDFTVLELGVNLGIATALNTGVRWARARGFPRVALFDQDSTVTDGFMRAMEAEYDLHPQREKIAVVTPSQLERNNGRMRFHGITKDGGPLVAITSGSLMPVEIFDRCGWFEDALIIDCVDHEYCLRARSLGYTVVHCRQAVLLVAVGSVISHGVMGLKIYATHHSAKRRYYMTRNRLVMIKRFWRQQPGWCYRALRDVVKETIKVALLEEERGSKLRNTAQGIQDALHGRMGKVVEL